MLISLPPDKLADIQQLALSLLHTSHVTFCKVMSFLGKAIFCTNGHSQLQHLCHVIQSDMQSVYHSPTQLFSHVHFSLSSLCQLEWLSSLQQSPVPLHFPLPDVVIATDATPTHWAFYFQGSGLPLSVSGACSDSLSRAHIALHELQAVAIMLHRMAFHFSSKVVALHLDNSTAKAYLCNQGGTVSPFSFQTGLLDTESDPQAWYYSYSSIHRAKTIIQGLVVSKMDYCNSLLGGMYSYDMKKLQCIQNVAARIIFCQSKYCHITPLLKELHWLQITERIDYKIAVIVFCCRKGLAPNYLSTMIVKSHNRPLRSTTNNNLPVNKFNTTVVNNRSFKALGPRIWNNLPDRLRNIEDINISKAEPKTFLFRRSYM